MATITINTTVQTGDLAAVVQKLRAAPDTRITLPTNSGGRIELDAAEWNAILEAAYHTLIEL